MVPLHCSDVITTGDPLHSRAACTQPCNVNTHSRAHCSPGARLCEQWGHGCVNNGARLCASARLCRGSPVITGPMALQTTSLAIVYSSVYFGRRSKKTSKLRVTGLCAGNSPVTGEFPAQMANNAKNVSIWWRHHDMASPDTDICTVLSDFENAL